MTFNACVIANIHSQLTILNSEVSKCIKQLKRNGNAGPDNLPAQFYKVTNSFVRFPLSIIFNLSVQTGELPDIWKVASVTPYFQERLAKPSYQL